MTHITMLTHLGNSR